MQLDRSVAPNFQTVQTVQFPTPQKAILDNDIPLYVINIGQQPVMRLEIIFEAGSWYESKAMASFFAMKMLSEGTKRFSSTQISEYFDSMGAFLELGQGFERANVTVYGLTKYLKPILEMVRELLFEATFPEKELNDLKNTTLQGLKVNLEKNAYLATVAIREKLFGATHPYGRAVGAENIEKFKQADVIDFYDNQLKNRPFTVFLSGKVGSEEIELCNEYLGKHQFEAKKNSLIDFKIETTTQNHTVEKTEALQSSIRVGRLMFRRQHPDFFPFVVLNEILGGYFGSRLMKNIREDKGYTYGISSALFPMRQAGYWNISTDVKKEFRDATFEEIEKEIKLLQTKLVAADELEIVKNYMAGRFAGSLNTPFEIADRVRLMVQEELPTDYYEQYIGRIRAVSAEQIIEMANKYFNTEDLINVSIG